MLIMIEYTDGTIEMVSCWRDLKYRIISPHIAGRKVRCYRKIKKKVLQLNT